MWLIRPMRFFKVCFGPFIWLLRGASMRLLRLIGAKPVSSHSLALSEEELLILLAESKRAGVVSAGEQQMLQRVFKFHDKTVREIMKPRPDINALNLRASEDEIRAVFEQGYSRVPVYDKSLNNVKANRIRKGLDLYDPESGADQACRFDPRGAVRARNATGLHAASGIPEAQSPHGDCD